MDEYVYTHIYVRVNIQICVLCVCKSCGAVFGGRWRFDLPVRDESSKEDEEVSV